MAGDVATAGTAGTDVAQAAAGQQEPEIDRAARGQGGVTSATLRPARPAEALPGGTATEACRHLQAVPNPPCRTPADAASGPRHPAANPLCGGRTRPAGSPGAAAAPNAAAGRHRRGPPPAGPARRATRRRGQPGAGAADQDRPRDPPQGRRAADRARLRGRRPPARRPDAQERRPVHHPPARGGHDPGRARHEPRDAVRGAAARHHRGHRLHPGRAAPRVRRRHRRRWSTA